RFAREQLVLVTLAAAYLVSGRIGLALSYGYPAASLVWPSAGFALAAFLVLGFRIWPVVFGAAVVLYASTLGASLPAILLAGGSTIERMVAAYLVNRYADGRHALQSPRNSLRFCGIVLLSSGATAILSAFLTAVSGIVGWADFGALWGVRTLGAAVGMLIVTPPIVLSTQNSRVRVSWAAFAEGVTAF